MDTHDIRQYLFEDARTLGLFMLVAGTLGWFGYLWLLTDASWLHPELLGTAAYIWNFPESATLPGLFRKVFDWKAFDPNVNRVRPLNDVFEVVDAVARPYVTRWIGSHASLTPSAVLTALLAPIALYAWLRRITGQGTAALVLCMVLIASIGFLSLTLPYIRPAKKLNLILLCGALLFAERYHAGKRTLDFASVWFCLLASFFSDELGLANFVVIGVLYWQSLFPNRLTGVALSFLSLPVVFLALTKWGLPAIYAAFSVHGAWDALADARKYEVFGYLLDWRFYVAAAIQTSRSILSTVGIASHVPMTEAVALVMLTTAPALHAYFWRLRSFGDLARDRFILATVVLVATSLFGTLLDWYPFPYEVSYLGSYNYYYHSAVVIPVIVWLAFGWESLSRAIGLQQRARLAIITAATIAVGLIVVAANFIMFERINRLVQVIHLYPFTNSTLFEALNEVRMAHRSEPVTVVLRTDRVRLVEGFERDLSKVFGGQWQDNGYHRVFELIAPNPIMSRAHVDHLFRAFFPFTVVNIQVKEEER